MIYMRVLGIVVFLFVISITKSYSAEFICSFDTMLTADVNRDSPNYQKILELKARSKFVFDITDQSLVVNGEEYITVFSSNNNLFVYSNKDFPYIMFYFYPNENILIMIGMQESANDTFLKADTLRCYNFTRGVLPSIGQGGTPVAPAIVPTPLVAAPLAQAPVAPYTAAPVAPVNQPPVQPQQQAPTPPPAQQATPAPTNNPLINPAIVASGVGETIIIPPPTP
ncbi:MAG: hypothetical protein LBH40_05555 [Alphaproteobacteria bacterium]|jgi:hypothetical protein|nr:hypothetical protein [Alphaproteobacteria bacterium]